MCIAMYLHLPCGTIFMRENIDKTHEFLMIHQNFPYLILLLSIANVVPDTDKFSQCQFVNIFTDHYTAYIVYMYEVTTKTMMSI